MAALGPAVIPALLTATETVPWLAPMAASTAAAAGTAGLGTAAGLGAGLGGFTPGVLTAANGMMIPTGITPTAMGALGAGDVGMAASLAGNSLQNGISGLLSPMRMVDPVTLQPKFSGLLRGANTARTGLQMMQGGQPQGVAQRPAPRAAPVQSGPPPQVARNVPTPAQLAAWRRVKGRMGQNDQAMV